MASTSAQNAEKFVYPRETTRHEATILGFPSKFSIAAVYHESACADIASLACAISAFEPVRLYTRPEDVSKANPMLLDRISEYRGDIQNISIIPFPTNHLWVRDTGPIYVHAADENDHKKRYAVNFRFAEWGKKDDIGDHDRASDGLDWPVMTNEQLEENATFARRVIESDISPSPVSLVESSIRLEGGALVVDGEGTLLATKSSIINENRNPGLSQDDIETELRRILGVEKIIWFPGRKDLDVTDVHADAEVNFIQPGVIVLSRPHSSVPKPWLEVFGEIREILSQSTDAKGRKFEVHIIDEPDPKALGPLSYDEPATNYVNCYFVNGGLVIPHFGDKDSDKNALEIFQKLCPDRVIQPVYVTGLPLAGGVIHCATQPVLAAQD
ncbi:hypothetical protein N7478_003700 [Penicillium angulare]|uniref:uncharacterized protein n=1 Tax=Penicillium angulare TaxID=116970 RepID=UPI0025404038|nr:uncharacterized protein N7478_003700 [Penicillium angulare]KAJ5288014.1 hypothetical protein N7478_003700 [Penicillium angulare]